MTGRVTVSQTCARAVPGEPGRRNPVRNTLLVLSWTRGTKVGQDWSVFEQNRVFLQDRRSVCDAPLNSI